MYPREMVLDNGEHVVARENGEIVHLMEKDTRGRWWPSPNCCQEPCGTPGSGCNAYTTLDGTLCLE